MPVSVVHGIHGLRWGNDCSVVHTTNAEVYGRMTSAWPEGSGYFWRDGDYGGEYRHLEPWDSQ